MAALSSLTPSGPFHLIWNSLRMPPGLLATVSFTRATGFPNPGHLNSRTDPFSGSSFTQLPLPAYSGDNSCLERSSSFTATTKQWSIVGLPEHPETPLSCISSALYFLVRTPTIIQSLSPILLALITQSLIPYPIYRSRCSAAFPDSRCGTKSCSQVSADPLAHRLAFLQSQAIANSTRRSYQAGLRRYAAFCASKGWQCLQATETTLRFFAAYLADQVSFKTIKLYLAGIRFAHTENSLPDPFQEAPLLHLLLRGIKRTVGLSSRQHLHITMSLLRRLRRS